MRTTLTRSKDEGGFALPVALLMMFICLLWGWRRLRRSRRRPTRVATRSPARHRSTSRKSVIDAESLQLQNSWPGTSATAYPTTCNQSSTPATGCPGTGRPRASRRPTRGPSYSNISWKRVGARRQRLQWRELLFRLAVNGDAIGHLRRQRRQSTLGSCPGDGQRSEDNCRDAGRPHGPDRLAPLERRSSPAA